MDQTDLHGFFYYLCIDPVAIENADSIAGSKKSV
jgi:hypothetical protein